MTLEEAIKRYTSNAFYEKSDGNLQGCLEFNQLAEWLKDYKRLLEQEPYDDAISRQAVLEIHSEYGEYMGATKFWEFRDNIRELPSINPQEPKTGHWKRIGYDIYECSICGQDVMTGDICAYRHCHCCGAKMIEPQERSNKE